MLHLLSSLFFVLALAGMAVLVVDMVRSQGAQILSALLNEASPPAPRQWNARVRTVSAPRPISVRLSPRLAAA